MKYNQSISVNRFCQSQMSEHCQDGEAAWQEMCIEPRALTDVWRANTHTRVHKTASSLKLNKHCDTTEL